MGAGIGTGIEVAGSVVKKVIGANLDPNDPKYELNTKIVKERINDIREITELRLAKFYNEMVLNASESSGKSETVPICSVVDSKEALYAATSDELTKNLPHTVQQVIDGALEGKWKQSINDLITGGLSTFFGPTSRASSGISSDTKVYSVVWANNAMLRLDIYVTKTNLREMAGFDKSQEVFGGYVMVISVVDIARINWQVFLYEFSKFNEKARDNDRDACDTLLRSIKDTRELVKALDVLFEQAKDIGPQGLHQKDVTAEPLSALSRAVSQDIDS